jgi:predicted AlkP superfamily pyrophosphatase or phosphodiesterase
LVKRILFIGLVILSLVGLYWWGLKTPTEDLSDASIATTSKPVILLVIDSLMDEPLQEAMKEGKAPALKFFMEHGHYYPEIVSAYPTMSVTIDSTLLTGVYANEHKIPGLIWFTKDENRLINYGTGMKEVRKHGVKQAVKDGLIHLNQKHLSEDVFTIYEELTSIELQSASINGLVYRADYPKQLNIPKLASLANIIPDNTEIKGPDLLSLGSLSQFNPENNRNNQIWRKMGFNDRFTANELRYLIQQEKIPAFTLAYFPDLDKKVHDNGPTETNGIAEMDKQLQSILNSYKSWDEALKKAIWIVYGDSGQSLILDDRNVSLIDLQSLLGKYRIRNVKEPIDKQDELLLAVNERMAYIYLVNNKIDFSEVISTLKKDSRIGFIAWKEEDINHVISAGSDEKFTFSPKGKYTDSYDQSWELNGASSILNLSTNENNEIQYGDYPDALARLHGALNSHEGRFVVVDAKPGYEFIGKYSPTHIGGGGHGSLHKDDSLTPLLIVGTDKKPAYNRIVDFKDWILELTKQGE